MIEVDERVAADGRCCAPRIWTPLRERAAPAYADGIRAVAVVCLHGHLLPRARAGGRRARRADRLPQVSLLQRGQPADEAGAAGRHHGRGRLPLADPAPLRRPGGGGADAGVAADVHAVQRRAGRGRGTSAARTPSSPARPAASSAWCALSQLAGFDQGHRLRHGRHLHRRLALRRASSSGCSTPQVAGVRMRAPMLDIHTVAAGGGSILHFDGAPYRVGPGLGRRRPGPGLLPPRRPAHRHRRQRDARPGPARPLPAVFGPGGDQPLDADVVRRAVHRARRRDRRGHRRRPAARRRSPTASCEIAVANMANAIKKISVQRGHDVTEYVLTTLRRRRRAARLRGRRRAGHAGPCWCHRWPGVLSALRIGLADVTAMREQSVEARARAARRCRACERSPTAGGGGRARSCGPRACPPSGSGSSAGPTCATRAPTPRCRSRWPGWTRWPAAFEAAYRRRYSFLMDRPLIVEAVSVEAVGTRGAAGPRRPASADRAGASRHAAAPQHGADVHRRPVARGAAPPAGRAARRRHASTGPAIIAEANATTVVDPGWRATVTDRTGTCCWTGCGRPAAGRPGRHRGRPGAAGDLQQPLHVDRRADGRPAGVAPPSRSTSRSGWTSPARSSTRTATSSPTRRTCRSTSARWAPACRR